MDDITVVVRFKKRHIFQFVRNLRRTWNHVLMHQLPILIGEEAAEHLVSTSNDEGRSREDTFSWKLVFHQHHSASESFITFFPDDPVGKSLAEICSSTGRSDILNGRMHVTLVMRDPSTGLFPELDRSILGDALVFVPSDTPAQLPRSLVEFIDHLRPAAQVS